jgi:hypothetical protein
MFTEIALNTQNLIFVDNFVRTVCFVCICLHHLVFLLSKLPLLKYSNALIPCCLLCMWLQYTSQMYICALETYYCLIPSSKATFPLHWEEMNYID